jgi:phosphoribosyl 1,2-cyclic phosphodiesterase
MIDCGLPIKTLLAAMQRMQLEPDAIDAVFITHEHGDHIKGLRSFLRRHAVPSYMTRGTAEVSDSLSIANLQIIADLQQIVIGGICVKPVIVPHDAREPCQYVISLTGNDRSLGVITDLGSCSQHVVDHFANCDAYVLECNHDIEMLKAGVYPPSVKKRVLSDWGHLSNCQARDMLARFGCDKLQWLVLAHLSMKNNDKQLALGEITTVFPERDRIFIADQQNGFDWLEIA